MIEQDTVVGVERRGFAQVVKARPDEFSANGRVAFEGSKLIVGQGVPAGFLGVVDRHLELAREVLSARADGRTALAGIAHDVLVAGHVQESAVEVLAAIRTHRIVHAVNVHLQLRAVDCRAQRTQVVVITRALDFHLLAVEQEPFIV